MLMKFPGLFVGSCPVHACTYTPLSVKWYTDAHLFVSVHLRAICMCSRGFAIETPDNSV